MVAARAGVGNAGGEAHVLESAGYLVTPEKQRRRH
ncbi:hypothetical protein PC128_g20614 [Phytophthora cactorum]|nr:hypothetical protein PC128_g20614 [Phytophthora cactorum]